MPRGFPRLASYDGLAAAALGTVLLPLPQPPAMTNPRLPAGVRANEPLTTYLRVYAGPEGVISYNVAFNVPSILESDDECVDVEEEIDGQWLNVEICSTE